MNFSALELKLRDIENKHEKQDSTSESRTVVVRVNINISVLEANFYPEENDTRFNSR